MSVKDMTARLARCTGQEEGYLARQIRHWTVNGLFMFEPPERSGNDPHSRSYYNDRHLAAARLYNFFVNSGVHVSRLEGLGRAFKNLDHRYPWIQEDGYLRQPSGIETVVDAAKRGELHWHFVYGGDLEGNLIGFYFTEHPWPNERLIYALEGGGEDLSEADKGLIRMAHKRRALRYPLHGVLSLAPLFRRLFTPDAGGEA
ncbi:hypothetical protein [Stappia indica]|uniref:hypothetical protein n=1 Tax=Stappia indica TaxID=538381 RepID=UPI001CD51ACD|nr:hypothetical protein [Stappia indica]MCA1298504.1 hypothetical protein [Stappia indica]